MADSLQTIAQYSNSVKYRSGTGAERGWVGLTRLLTGRRRGDIRAIVHNDCLQSSSFLLLVQLTATSRR